MTHTGPSAKGGVARTEAQPVFMPDAGIAVLLAAVQGTARAGTAHGVRAFAHPTRLATLSRMAVNGSSLARYL